MLHKYNKITLNACRFLFVACASMQMLACSGDHVESEASAREGINPREVQTVPSLENTHWQAVTIDGADANANASPTLLLNADGQLTGSSGCNHYFGRWSATDDEAQFVAGGATARACEPELMDQERAFFDALKDVTAATIGPDGNLSLLDASSTTRLSLKTLEQTSTAADTNVPLDLPATTFHKFSCDEKGLVEFRFVGPDTIELLVGPDRYILQHQEAASGARYAGGDVEFWNHGDEAMLVIGDQQYQCVRSEGRQVAN